MAIGVFGLQVAYRLKRLEVMSLDNTHGWFGGGNGPVSTVDRIDFSNDTATASARGPLSLARHFLSATGNSNYGWFGGGVLFLTATPYSTVDRIDFSNDSTTASPRGPLGTPRYYLAATGNSNYGWFGGGYSLSPNLRQSVVNRTDFSNDSSTASIRGSLSVAKTGVTATANSNYGWFGGGNIAAGPALVSTIDRVDFSNDFSIASPRGVLSSTRYSMGATGNANYGWFGGGQQAIGPTGVSLVDRIDFSNDLGTTLTRGVLAAARAYLSDSATGNSNYGWFGGGQPGPLSSVNRIDFSNDSVTASQRGPLSVGRFGTAATSGQAKGPSIKLQKGGNFGWFGGGRSPAATAGSTVDRIDFSNDLATASPRGPLSAGRYGLGAAGNTNYGWYGGGFPGVSTVDRIDFSNDSATASPRGVLSLSPARQQYSATGNSNYGWYGGGRIPSPASVSSVDRMDFSNDFSRASVRGTLTQARYGLGATGNSNYGWFGGGQTAALNSNAVATVDRIDFSNDLATASPRGPLSAGRRDLTATGNSNYGWFGAGVTAPSAIVATVDRINFSNDSVTASVRGPLSLARDSLTATGNSNYGWFGGGSPATAIVDRIDFSNDLATTSPRGSLSLGRFNFAATSNTPIG